jgi:hypothetical protein
VSETVADEPTVSVTDADPPEAEIVFRSDVTVELVKANAHDSDVVFAARVSTAGEQSLEDVESDASRSKGLVNFLMRERHGCYDAATDVLTSEGWKRWPEVMGDERFVTLSPDGRIELQRAERLVAYDVDGPMVRVRMAQVDLLVTPDHRMLARRRRQSHNERWELVPAADLTRACHRLRTGGGRWRPEFPTFEHPPGFLALLGFFIGDGDSAGGTPSFRLRKEREISYLLRQAARAGFAVTRNGERFYLRADEEFRLLA